MGTALKSGAGLPATRRGFLRQACAAALLAPATRPPNILVIVTDDHGYADLSAYPHHAPDIATPNMDRIASQGVRFPRAYVAAPVCAPSRAGWNTGRYQHRWDPKAGQQPGLPRGEKTLAEYLEGAGYATGKTGKNDFGRGYHTQDTREYPLNHGYHEFLGFSSHAHDYFLLSEKSEKSTPDPHGHSAALGTLFENRGRRSFETGYTTDIFTDWAIRFLERRRAGPFFLHVAYNSVHQLVHEVPERYLKKFGAKPIPNYDPATMGNYVDYYDKYAIVGATGGEEMRRYYLANLNCLDDNIGRLLNAVDRLGLARDTLVVFFSDNGGAAEGGGNNRPLRGSKSTVFEGGIRVPFMMRWPGRLPEKQTYPYRVSTLDILPTCLEAAGIPARPSPALDGASFLEAVRSGKPSPAESRPLFWVYRNRWAVMDGDWKLVHNPGNGPRPTALTITSGDPAGDRPALFNLRKDPAEQHDVSGRNPEIVRRLTTLFEGWRREMGRENGSL